MAEASEPEIKRTRLDTSPPLYGALKFIYQTTVEQEEKRYKDLERKFSEKYKHPPAFFARAPGRVNIIGEHIDYCGYGVLPMAVEQDIVIAASVNPEGKLDISNTNPNFPDFSVDSLQYKIDGKEWYHYFLCGYKGIVDLIPIIDPVGMNLFIDGTVPKSAGLSSSSALVCCSCLVTLHANTLELSKHELAEVCTKCERFIGTEGGGMDQAISFLAEPGTAKNIEFDPIRAFDVKLPDGIAFVIANSLVEMNKSVTAGTHFNVRVVECRLAAKVLAKSKGLKWRQIRKLAEVQEALAVSLDEMVAMVDSVLHKDPYSQKELCELFSLDEEELVKECMSESTAKVTSFKLHDRAKHVYSEAGRVLKFKHVCQENPGDAAQVLGSLMNESHTSCSKMYECSCEELDNLVAICRRAGALGSRLTGAGWGGCTVSMVRADALEDFIAKVSKEYYESDPGRKARVTEALFATKPGSGAALVCLN